MCGSAEKQHALIPQWVICKLTTQSWNQTAYCVTRLLLKASSSSWIISDIDACLDTSNRWHHSHVTLHTACRLTVRFISLLCQKQVYFLWIHLGPKNFQYGSVRFSGYELKRIWINTRAKLPQWLRTPSSLSAEQYVE